MMVFTPAARRASMSTISILLRYNKALWEAVKTNSADQEGVIWARSAWAGSERFPLHWGGDAATNEIGSVGMMGDLRGG